MESGGVIRVENGAQGLWDDRDPRPFQLILEQVFGKTETPREAILGGILNPVVDHEYNVYLFDYYSRQLVSFDSNGEVRWRVGEPGSGPGEFAQGMIGLASDGESTLYVTNGDGTRFDMWSTSGGFINTRRLQDYGINSPALVVGFIQSNHLVLSRRLPELASEVIVLDVETTDTPPVRFKVEAGPFSEPPDESARGPVSIGVGGGEILAGNLGAYSLSAFDPTGQPVRIVTRPVSYLKTPASVAVAGRSTGYFFGSVSAPFVLRNGFWLVQTSWPTNVDDPVEGVRRMMADPSFEVEWATSLDLFDEDGQYLLSLLEQGAMVSSIGTVVAVDIRGRLYTVSNDPFPQVRRYRVEITG